MVTPPADATGGNPIDAYFPFFVKDWLSDPNVAAMTPEQRGGYVQLLCYAWTASQPVSLPMDDEALARLSGLGLDRWATEGRAILALLAEHPDYPNRYTSPRLLRAYREALAVHQSRVERGKAGAATRWGQHGAQEAPPQVPPAQVKKALRQAVDGRAPLKRFVEDPVAATALLATAMRWTQANGLPALTGLVAIVATWLDERDVEGPTDRATLLRALQDWNANNGPTVAKSFRAYLASAGRTPRPGARPDDGAQAGGTTFDTE